MNMPLPSLAILISAVLVLSCGQTDRQNHRQNHRRDDRYTDATTVIYSQTTELYTTVKVNVNVDLYSASS